MSVASPQGAHRIAGFDGLRAIGFLLVFISHKFPTATTGTYGATGVWIFFVLSGFLISRILRDQAQDIERGRTTVPRAIKRFYARRSARILPVYYCLLIVLGAISLLVTIDNMRPLLQLAYWTQTTNLYIATYGWIGRFGHFWSLATEFQYYIVFAPVALLLGSRRIWVVCAVFLVGGAVANVHLVTTGASEILLDMHPLPGFALFGLGGLAGLLADSRLGPQVFRLPSLIPASLATCLVVPLLFADSYAFFSYARAGAPVIAVLLLAVAACPNSASTRALEWRPLRELGVVSYGAYLVHPFVSLSRVLQGLSIDPGASAIWHAIVVALELVVTVVIARVAWQRLEKPVIDWVKVRHP